MRLSTIASMLSLAALGLASNACSMLGAYANGASSMMTQPTAGTPSTPTSETTSGTSSSPTNPTASDTTPEKAKEASAPTTVSVTLRNSCSKTVKLFYGEKPKYGSGRYTSVSSNSRLNQTFRPGDQIWIVDDGQNGVENVKLEPGMQEVEIASTCDSFRTR